MAQDPMYFLAIKAGQEWKLSASAQEQPLLRGQENAMAHQGSLQAFPLFEVCEG